MLGGQDILNATSASLSFTDDGIVSRAESLLPRQGQPVKPD